MKTPFVIRAGAVYRKVEAQMTVEQAEETAVSISTDIQALALFLKERGFNKDYSNAMGVAQSFSKMADKLGMQAVG